MYEELAKNVRRTWVLLIGFIAVVALIGWGFSVAFAWGPTGVIIAVVVALAMTWGSYFKGDAIVLRAHRARLVSHEDEPRLYNLVEGLCIAGGLPMPKIYVVEDPAPNAFATGRDPDHASIAVTRGLLDKMNRVELEGVVAHELAHVKNRDTLVMAIAATLVGVVVLISDWTIRSFWWGAHRRRPGMPNGGPAAIFALLGLGLAILGPLVAQIMRMSISRRREYFADVTGVQMTRYPPGLISALEKLNADQTVVRTASRATAHLWIESPLQRGKGFLPGLNRLFQTHPPLEERIALLREL